MKAQPELKQNNIKQTKLSANSMVTAWQISSTLSKMEQFISFIGSFQQQSRKLHFLLPYVNKVKKLQEDKQTLNKNLNYVIREENQENLQNDKKHLNKKTGANTSQDNKKFHKSHLIEMIKSLKKQNIQNSRKIDQIRETIRILKNSQTKQIQDAEASLQNKFKQIIFQESNEVENQIRVQKNYYHKKQSDSIYSSFVNMYLYEKLSFHNGKTQQNNHENSKQIGKYTIFNNFESKLGLQGSFSCVSSFQQIIAANYEQLGQIKCKILSLQDKKRQSTVQNLLKQKTLLKSMLDPSNLDAENNRNSSRKRKNEAKSSFFTIFSSRDNVFSCKDNVICSKEDEHEHKLHKDKTDQNDQNVNIIDSQTQQEQNLKLRIIQVKSQILQFSQHLDIAFNQNIAKEIFNYASRMKSLTEQLKNLTNEIIQVILVVNVQKREKCLQIEDKMGNERKAQVKGYTRQNQNIQFFLTIIRQKIQKRHLILVKLLFAFRLSIQAFNTYINDKTNQIKSSLEQITQQINDSSKNFRENPQIHNLLYSTQLQFQNIERHTTSIIKVKLSYLDKLFRSEIQKYAQIYATKISQMLMSHRQMFGDKNQHLEDMQFQVQRINCSQQDQFSQFVILQTKTLEYVLSMSDEALQRLPSHLNLAENPNIIYKLNLNDSPNLEQSLNLTATLNLNNNSNNKNKLKSVYEGDKFIQQTKIKQSQKRDKQNKHMNAHINDLLFNFYDTFLQKIIHILQNGDNYK